MLVVSCEMTVTTISVNIPDNGTVTGLLEVPGGTITEPTDIVACGSDFVAEITTALTLLSTLAV